MNKITIILAVVFATTLTQAVEMGVPIQLKFKNQAGNYPDDSNADFVVQILSPSNGCVLREEHFANQNVVSGSISLALGSAAPSGFDPGITTLTAVYDNSTAKNNLTCVDVNNNQVSSGQTYNPAATDTRIIRIRATVATEPMVIDFVQRATPYAIHAESVGGKVASDILVQNGATSLNQSNLETLLLNATRFNKLQNLAVNGIADNAATATTATNFSGSLTGDVTGTQSATVVGSIRGVGVAATAPTSGQVLAYNGSQYVPMTFSASSPVTSVNGQTGAVVLNSSHIAGVVTSATSLVGDVTGNIAATVVSSVGGKSAATVATAVNDVNSATSTATAGAIAKRDGSGNLTVAGLTATGVTTAGASLQNLYIYEGTASNRVLVRAANSFADYTLVLPTTDGNSGELLQTDGNGNLSWAAGVSVTSSAIVTALGYTPADNALVTIRSNNLSDLTSATVARSNLGLGSAAVLNIGTTAGTVAAGDDSRITGALAQSAFDAYVASAGCTAGQSMYWNSVSSTFVCQNILVSGDISGVASSVTVTKVQGVGVSITALANNHILQYNGANFVNRAVPTCAGGEYLTFNGTSYSCVTDAGGGGTISSISVTAPISSTGGSAPTLSISQASGSANGYLSSTDWTVFNNKLSATSAAVIAALGYTPADSAASGTYLVKASNLSDLTSATVARSNLGLGGAAILNVGTTAGTVAAGDDSRIANAIQTSTSFSGDVTGVYNAIALVNSGVTSGTYAKVTVNGKGIVTSGASLTSSDVVTALGYTPANNAASGTYLVKASNLSDLTSATVARSNLGLGGAAILNVGTTAGTVAAGDDSRITDALGQTAFNTYVASANCTTAQTMYWNSVSSTFACQNISVSGDITGVASSVTVTKLQNTGVSFSSIATGHILQYNGTNIINRAVPTCAANQYLTFNGTAWSCVTDVGSGGIVSSIAVTAPLQSTGGSTPTLSMPQATSSVSGYLTAADWTTFNNKITSSAASIAAVLGYTPANSSTVIYSANNLSDLTNVITARTNLGLGTFATANSVDLGTASATGTLATARLPNFTGDVTSTAGSNSLTVTKIQGVDVDATAPTTGQVLRYNGTSWVPTTGLTEYGRVTANQTIPNTTYVDLTNLSFSVVAGNTYKFRFSVIFSIPSTTRAPRFLLGTPTATVIAAQAQVPSSTSALTTTIIATQSGTAIGATNVVNGQVLISLIEGIIVPSANGVVKLQASPSNTTNMTVYAGSTLEWTQVP